MTAYGRHVRHEGCRFRTKWHEVARSWSRHVVLAGSTDQYLAGCWHSQESTNLCTRDDEILAATRTFSGSPYRFFWNHPPRGVSYPFFRFASRSSSQGAKRRKEAGVAGDSRSTLCAITNLSGVSSFPTMEPPRRFSPSARHIARELASNSASMQRRARGRTAAVRRCSAASVSPIPYKSSQHRPRLGEVCRGRRRD